MIRTAVGKGWNIDTVFAVSYQSRKYGIVGPAWKMPFIGPFLESMHPNFMKYKSKWESGELSCVSVFHK